MKAKVKNIPIGTVVNDEGISVYFIEEMSTPYIIEVEKYLDSNSSLVGLENPFKEYQSWYRSDILGYNYHKSWIELIWKQ